MKVAFCASEVFPFAKTGGMADVCGALPIALEAQGVETIVFLPKYKGIEEKFDIRQVSERAWKGKIGKDITVYCVANDALYDRDNLYGDDAGDYPDNLERFQFFSRSVFDILKEQDIQVDVLHCHDWQTGLIPVYLKEEFRYDSFFENTKSVLTLHNLAYQGLFPQNDVGKLGLQSQTAQGALEFYDKISLLKAGVIYSDEVNTVSPQYAQDIQTKELGCGLEDVIAMRENKVHGILNGLDYDHWDPSKDELLAQIFTAKEYKQGKQANKSVLQAQVGLPVDKETALFGFVGRLTHQKGVDLIVNVIDELASDGLQVVIQGTGAPEFHDKLKSVAQEHGDHFAFIDEYCEKTAHNIYAASDVFLMPSEFEPCGLTQMISMRYGTLPLVYKTGGLADTVINYFGDEAQANGFVFDEYTPSRFLATIKEVDAIYKKGNVFDKLIGNALKADFSWKKSAQKYSELYLCLS